MTKIAGCIEVGIGVTPEEWYRICEMGLAYGMGSDAARKLLGVTKPQPMVTFKEVWEAHKQGAK